jgi:hypothetical protein
MFERERRAAGGRRIAAKVVTVGNVPAFAPKATKPQAARGGRSPRRKGSGFEREVVALLQQLGLAAEKIPLSGSIKGGRFDHDVSVPVRGIDRRIECKRRKRAFATISKMLSDNYALVVRDDHARPLVIMSLQTFGELAR